MTVYHGDCERMIAQWREYAANHYALAKQEEDQKKRHRVLRLAWRYLHLAKQLSTMIDQGNITYSSTVRAVAVRSPKDSIAKAPEKPCVACGVLKPLRRFGTKSGNPDGYHDRCKHCRDLKRDTIKCT